jgi:seryl-tRNA synthetase
MIDIRLIRETPEVVREDLKKRGMDTTLVDQAAQYDKQWREGLQEMERLKHERNVVTGEIAQLKKSGKKADDKIKAMGKIADRVKELEQRTEDLKQKTRQTMLLIPNLLHKSVPKGEGEEDNQVIREWGKRPKFRFKPRDHIEIGELYDLIDIERAAKVSGARFYYLKNEAVQIEFALVRYVFDILIKEGFVPIVPPVLLQEKVMEGAGFLPAGREDIYKIEGEPLYLVGTSEQSLAGMHMDEILERGKLPLCYCAFSSCFRTEAGSHGRDTKGIFRVHQFDKIEMFKFTAPEDSWKEHESLLKVAEGIYRGLGIPYRIVNVCTGEMGFTAAKKYDLEAWLPGQGAYREIVSCSNCTDYQARRLNIRCRKNPGDPTEVVHTLNSTACAIGRTIVAILENCQGEDGVAVPKALRAYAGIDEIKVR